ncbi:hypothetical protein DNHGIG_25250 [Collibacillus ludicampi]|uniref:Uncharacterized protein n=1 Tax=Collibacillus ludicampi TaxID=2771369 RepID=A0AAV4LGW7_9BACL|nr:hypothetical protein [Collibacillus ludicampi]GIM46976.1 hypothetical protein DNHGIG_25250 [Collibacillus ludicampi]
MYPVQGRTHASYRQAESFHQTEAFQRLSVEIEHLVELVRESQFNQHEFMTKSYELLREYARDVEQVQADVRSFLEKARFMGVRSDEVNQILEKLDAIIFKLGNQGSIDNSHETITYSDIIDWPQGHGGFLGCKEFVTDVSAVQKESSTQAINKRELESQSQFRSESHSRARSESMSRLQESDSFRRESPSRLARESYMGRESRTQNS